MIDNALETESAVVSAAGGEAKHLRDLSPQQWRSGIAAWLGWLFDGLDGYLYILVATPFVASLLNTKTNDKEVGRHAAYIQAAFLVGWAVGGAVFGRIGDRFGRCRTISLTILTYAVCTGLAALAWNWQSLLVFRFLAALGIGGEWAAGASLIAETWPRKWRPLTSAFLQSAYQIGIIAACLGAFLMAKADPRYVFLIGTLPALVVFWIRRNIPEPEAWEAAKSATEREPGIADLFRGPVLKTTLLTIVVCSAALTTVWALIFWMPQHLRSLPDIQKWSPERKTQYVTQATIITMLAAIIGNFFAGAVARKFGYRLAIALMFAGGFLTLWLTYRVPRDHVEILYWIPLWHFFVQGVFGLFPLYVPPLFPTLLRTTGAGFCYNVGRLVAAVGTVVFSFAITIKGEDNYRAALYGVGFIYLPAIAVALLMPEPTE